jgi:RNA polymerase sigma factor (TIGR02999 family)
VTGIVAGLAEDPAGREKAADRLMPLVYDELRRMARAYMARERGSHTLQPTALVHEAYLKLVDQSRVDWQGQTHFRAVAAKVMRRLLVDHARRHASAKRGGDQQRVTLQEGLGRAAQPDLDLSELLDLSDALDRLGRVDPRQARILELRTFGGMTTAEVAEAVGVSKRTVEADWMHGRAWLRRELTQEGES